MSERRVWVDAWQMQCCGDPFTIGSSVSWTVTDPDLEWLSTVLGDKDAARITDAEEHHEGRLYLAVSELTGTVRSIDAVACAVAPRPGPDTRTRYPVEGRGVTTSLSAADGSGREELDPDRVFLGYVVRLDVPLHP